MTSNIILQGLSGGQTVVTVGYGGTYIAPSLYGVKVTMTGENGIVTLIGKGSSGTFFNPEHFNPEHFSAYDYVAIDLEGDSGEVELD